MAEDRVLFALRDRTCFLKLVGDAKYTTTTGFDSFINELFDRDEVDDVLVDLTETTYIDSTNLGELTKISTFLMQRRSRRPTLVSTREDICAIITGLGLDRVFVVADHAECSPNGMAEVPDIALSERENAARILEAHRYLVALNAKNGAIFRSVVDAFERELGEGGSKGAAAP